MWVGVTAKVMANWVVTIRCAKPQNQARLFAGAGIVPASPPLASGAKQASSFLPC
ncbi:hypothetical protein ACNKHR_04205 [Shigella flexneri]